MEFYDALAARADGLFELVDAMLCADRPVKSLVELSLVPEHRRGHGSLYDGVNIDRRPTGHRGPRRRMLGHLPARTGHAPDRRPLPLYPGEAKTDARDAFIIADAARTMPHTLRNLEPDDETIAALHMLLGFDDDLAAEATRTSNRMRGLLTAIHPHLERVIGPRIRHPAILNLLEHYGSPAAIQSAGLEEITEVLRAGAPRMAGRLATDILAALDDQTVVVPGTNSAAIILPSLAASLRTVLDQHRNSPPTSRSC